MLTAVLDVSFARYERHNILVRYSHRGNGLWKKTNQKPCGRLPNGLSWKAIHELRDGGGVVFSDQED
jgi:hypothetical protein